MVKNHNSKPSPYSSSNPVSISGFHGQILEVTVVGCNRLKDTEWISRQDPYVCLEYSSFKYRTRTCTDGGKTPTFQEKFMFTLIEGLPEFSVSVWNSNTITADAFIGVGKIQLQKVLSQGYDDSAWPIQDKRGRHAGEVRLIMHYANATKPTSSQAPQFSGTPAPQVPPYSVPPPSYSYPPTTYPPSYPPPPSSIYPPSPYHHQVATYPPSYPPASSYPPQSVYPPNPYPPPPGAYPPPY
ncbi:elicitor-responsive protein 1-like [Andrographis paniculata]|uniref:elicitor-responsive protein 1-like n=1 Tax=Andrographis paniculata TaxID=175694 RepID=UPI0021E98B3A|nr:elicitor-responsive protein 1-like [Andrographis paniculata]